MWQVIIGNAHRKYTNVHRVGMHEYVDVYVMTSIDLLLKPSDITPLVFTTYSLHCVCHMRA